ncbi:hypothetical protein Dda_1766 [Drechslerella dactyloides]|uniref:Uncharacterized protein n=1 Tax=Drechslerella dactyloides TaxID=74499 RepID=A0AAD6J4M5_DREDA|nr:hypothetical protein Dda_1766 [Drechslerella dactyloides]
MLLVASILSLLALSSPVAAKAKPDGLTVTLFPALPVVTEINQKSYVAASVLTPYNSADGTTASIVWGFGQKKAQGATTWDGDFYVQVTTWPAQSSQLLTYYTAPSPDAKTVTPVVEAACKVSSTAAATCQITPRGGAPTESVFNDKNIELYPFVFNSVPNIPGVSAAIRLVGGSFLGTVVASVAVVAIML